MSEAGDHLIDYEDSLDCLCGLSELIKKLKSNLLTCTTHLSAVGFKFISASQTKFGRKILNNARYREFPLLFFQ